MSVLQKIKEMSATPVKQALVKEVPVEPASETDAKLRRKAGVLAAFGLVDRAIADALLISLEQVSIIKETQEFRESCAKQTYERTQRLIDLEEGWDGIESAGVAQVLQHLQFSSDPEYALRAALMANKASRRSPTSFDRVIDASKVGNVITLTVNKNYITQVTNNGDPSNGIIETQARTQGEVPRKASDVSSPTRLTEILQVQTTQEKEQRLMALAETVGISIDELAELT